VTRQLSIHHVGIQIIVNYEMKCKNGLLFSWSTDLISISDMYHVKQTKMRVWFNCI